VENLLTCTSNLHFEEIHGSFLIIHFDEKMSENKEKARKYVQISSERKREEGTPDQPLILATSPLNYECEPASV
jgi:hypothetical protein